MNHKLRTISGTFCAALVLAGVACTGSTQDIDNSGDGDGDGDDDGLGSGGTSPDGTGGTSAGGTASGGDTGSGGAPDVYDCDASLDWLQGGYAEFGSWKGYWWTYADVGTVEPATITNNLHVSGYIPGSTNYSGAFQLTGWTVRDPAGDVSDATGIRIKIKNLTDNEGEGKLFNLRVQLSGGSNYWCYEFPYPIASDIDVTIPLTDLRWYCTHLHYSEDIRTPYAGENVESVQLLTYLEVKDPAPEDHSMRYDYCVQEFWPVFE